MKKLRIILSSAVSFAVVAAIVLLFISIAKQSDTVVQTQAVNTIAFEASNKNTDTFVTVADNDKFTLKANLKIGIIRLLDKASGTEWSSSPNGYDTNPDVKGAAKVQLGSPLNIQYSDRDSNMTTQNARAGCILKNNMNAKKIENGVRFEFYFDKEGFLVPLEIKLTNTGLNVNIPVKEIQEASNQLKLTGIVPLPNFGAAGKQENGYFLVPDGSGALINFNQNGLPADYTQDIYGSDLAVVSETKPEKTETARLPVFGIKKENAAFLSIITQGAARASLNVSVNGTRSPYSTGNVGFTYRDSATVEVNQKTFESTKVNMFEPGCTDLDDFTLEYRFLNGDKANYTGMAHAYQQYLIDEVGVKISVSSKSSPLTIDVMGGVMRQESVFGIPVNKVVPITSYADVEALAKTFADSGITNITYNYLYWSVGGTQKQIPVGLSAESGLGGSGTLKSMLKTLDNNHMRIFLDVNINDMQKSVWGYNTHFDSSKSVQKEPAVQFQYKMSTFRKDSSVSPTFLLSPNKVLEACTQVSKKASVYNFTGFSTGSLSQKIYSDFGENHLDRGSAEKVWQDSLLKLKDAKGALMASSPNAYVFPYATELTDVPITTSCFTLQSESVPFYQIALHGLLPVTVPSVNYFSDSRACVLKAVETGSNLKYTLGSRNIGKLRETDVANMYNIDASVWVQQAITDYKKVSAAIAKFSDQKIKSHEKLEDGVYKTTFENGRSVIVNYKNEAVTADDVTVGAQNFQVIGG